MNIQPEKTGNSTSPENEPPVKRKRGNPNLIPGAASLNPLGRGAQPSNKATNRLVERFLRRQLSPKRIDTIFTGLTARDKADFLIALLPYCTPKLTQVSGEFDFKGLPETQITVLHNQLMQTTLQVARELVKPANQLQNNQNTTEDDKQ